MTQVFTQAHARASDPSTSDDAAGSVRGLSDTRFRLLGIMFRHGDLSDEELYAWFRAKTRQGGFLMVSPSGLRTRRKELVDMGFVTDSGVRALSVSGRKMVVWQLTAAGREVYAHNPSTLERGKSC